MSRYDLTDFEWRVIDPVRHGPRTTCCNRFVRWRKTGVWDRLMGAVADPIEWSGCAVFVHERR